MFREKLSQAGVIKAMFERFDGYLNEKGYVGPDGHMVDATIVPVPRLHSDRDENEAVKRGETPPDWEAKLAKKRQRDRDGRWTTKYGKSFFRYKNQVDADTAHELIRDYVVTDAAVHDSRVLDELLDKANTSRNFYAGGASRSPKLASRGLKSRICVRGTRGHPLSALAQAESRTKSRLRLRVEHVFGTWQTVPKTYAGWLRSRDSPLLNRDNAPG